MRKITFLTGSRGEWGYIRPVLRLIDADPELDYSIIATNMHLLPEFGMSVREIEKDGFRIDERIHMTLDGYSAATMTKSLAVLLLELPTVLQRTRPDILLLAGDRGEQLMGAIAGSHMRIPVAHIQAGELSGNVDGTVCGMRSPNLLTFILPLTRNSQTA
jgi:GDP/UDP-N,N'-diacetylbacillosamine 2-epimerase (hydrolysing)